MKIYTKTGDKGTTATFSGERRAKRDAIFEALGTSDELSSHLGHARSLMAGNHKVREFAEELERIQCMLQDLQSSLATPQSAAEGMLEKVKFNADNIKFLEERIDCYTTELPELKNFILPGGSAAGSALHIARCVARRAERTVNQLEAQEAIDKNCAIFLNRVSDYLFTIARIVSYSEGVPETIYK